MNSLVKIIIIFFVPTLSTAMDIEMVERLKEHNNNFFISQDAYYSKIKKCNLSRCTVNRLKSWGFFLATLSLSFAIFFASVGKDGVGAVIIYTLLCVCIIQILRWKSTDHIREFIRGENIIWKKIFFLLLDPNHHMMGPILIVEASKHNKIDIARRLLKKCECIPELTDYDNESALDVAIDNDNLEMVELLLDNNRYKKFDLDFAVTQAILDEKSVEIIEILFKKGGKFIDLFLTDVVKWCTFFYCKLLVDLGIDVNIRDSKGCVPIIVAALRNKILVFSLLLSKNADIFAQDSEGKTVFEYLNEMPDTEETNLIRVKLRRKIFIFIDQYLRDANFPQDLSGMVSQYLV